MGIPLLIYLQDGWGGGTTTGGITAYRRHNTTTLRGLRYRTLAKVKLQRKLTRSHMTVQFPGKHRTRRKSVQCTFGRSIYV